MKSQMNYRTKRNVIIVAIIALLIILASVGIYSYIKGNSETQAMSEMNGTSGERAGEDVQVAQEDNGENDGEEPTEEATNDDSEEASNNEENVTPVTENNNTNSNNGNTPATDNNNSNTQNYVQNITTTETIERTENLVGFESTDINTDAQNVGAELPNVEGKIAAKLDSEYEYAKLNTQITYTITVKNNNTEAVEDMNVTAVVPEGADLVEDSVSDAVEVVDGKISWKVNVDANSEATVTYIVTVNGDAEEIVASAVVNGKDTNTVTTLVDTVAPELDVENLSEAGYVNTQGDRHVNVKDVHSFTTVVLNEAGEEVNRREAQLAEDGTYFDRFNINWLGEGAFTIIVTDIAGNVTEETFTVDVTAPVINIENINEAGYVNTQGDRHVNVDDANAFTTVILDENGEEIKTREGYVQGDAYHDRFKLNWLGEGTFIIRATDIAGNVTEKTVTVDITAPVRKSADYYVTGKTSIVQGDKDDEIGYQFFYAKNGDQIVLNAKFHEELAKVPTFVLIDSAGTKYPLTAEYVGLDDKGGYTYTASYDITEDEANMPEGEIRFEISDIVDKAGNVGDNIEKASNGRRIVYDRTIPTLTVKDGKDNKDREYTIGNEPDFSRISFALEDNILLKEYVINGKVCEITPNKWSDANYFENLEKVLVEGKNTILVRDMAGNESTTYEFNYDTKAPEYKTLCLHNDTHYNNGGDITVAANGDYIRFGIHFDEKLAVEPTIVLVGDGEKEKLTFTMTFREDSSSDTEFVYMADVQLTEEMKLPQGEINFEVSGYADAAGNVGETLTFEDVNHSKYNKVIYDTVAPVVGTDTGYPLYILNLSDENHRQYIKDGQTLKVEANFNEMLDGVPTLIIGNDENTQTTELEYKLKNGDWYVYVATIEIDNSILKLNEHDIIPFRIEGAKDAAGNTVELDNDDVTYTKEYGQVKYDNNAPILGEGHPLYILNRDDVNHRKYIGDGKWLRVEANFNEELAEEPILTIGKEEDKTQVAELKSKGYSEKNGNYVYVWDIKIDNSILQLAEHEIVPFTITNVVDLAGNEANFDNDNVSYTDEYGQVEYDNDAPIYQTLGILNTTHMNEGDDINYVRDGDNVRVLVWFKEKLAVEPKIAILNNDGDYVELEGGCKYTEDERENVHYYVANFTVTPEMNLPQGEIQFKIYGYEDAAGNVGKELTNKDINRTDYTKAIYDTVAPERVYSTVRLSKDKEENPYIGEDKNKYYYVKNGEEFEFAMMFTEELKQAPTVTIAGRNLEMTLNEKVKAEESKYLYEGTFIIPAEEAELAEGTLEIKVSNIVDFAGNVMEDNIQTPTSNGRIVIYDRTNPTFTNVENGKIYNHAVSPRIEETNLAKATITRPNGVTEDYVIDENGVGQEISANGEYTITLVDKAGNSTTVTFTIDTKAPVVTLKDVRGKVLEPDKIYSFDVYAFVEDITECTILLNGEEYKNGSKIWEKQEHELVVTDAAGNSVTVNFEIDKAKPKITGVENGESYTSAVTPVITDKNLDKVTLNDKEFVSGTTIIEDGDYKLVAVDKAGNKEIVNFTIDTTGPEATFDYSNRSSDGTFFTTQKDITVTLTVNEDLKVTPDGWKEAGERTYTRVHDANGTYTVILEDLLGNTTEVDYIVQKIDRKGPVIDIGATEVTFKAGKDILTYPEKGTVTDDFDGVINKANLSGVNIVWYHATADGEKGERVKEYDPIISWDTGLTDIPLGKYYIEYYAFDKAGNRGEAHKILNLVDTIAPEIVVPEKVTMESGEDILDLDEYYANGDVKDNYYSDMRFADVNAIMYYMEDGKKTDKIVQEFVDGKLWGTKLTDIPLGDYYVEYSIKDKSGNEGTAHTILTLQDTKAPTITVNGQQRQEIVIGSGVEYVEEGAVAHDLRDGDITIEKPARIDWYGEDGEEKFSIDPATMTYDKPGWYNIIYTATDEKGNIATEVGRLVYVVEK